MCMLYTNLFYLHRSLCSQLNRIKQVFRADSTCTSRSTYLYFWPRLANLLVLVSVGQPTCTSGTGWLTYLCFWPRLANNVILLALVDQTACTSGPGRPTYLYLCLLVNPLVLLAQAGHLSNPGVDHRLDLVLAHQRQCHVRLRAEAHHPAGSSSGCRSERSLWFCSWIGVISLKSKTTHTWTADRQCLLAQGHPQGVPGSHCWKQRLSRT